MKELLKGIMDLKNKELERANKEHPLFASDHEGYAVIAEEVDEAKEDFQSVVHTLGGVWDAVKSDDIRAARAGAGAIENYARFAAAEMIQVAAMCEKFIISQKERSKK